ncbi:MAG TPA: hypothetical protein DCZ69_08135 [Syntrophobacteraceae bacterium]|nr:hypothetical protein [Syntrophobacteraceae bacterium]
MPIEVHGQPFPTHPHTPWRLFLSRPARAPIVEMLYRTLRIEVNLDNITVERTSQWVRAQTQGQDAAGEKGSPPAIMDRGCIAVEIVVRRPDDRTSLKSGADQFSFF